MRGAIPPLLQYAFMALCLVQHRDNFTLPYMENIKESKIILLYLSTLTFISQLAGKIWSLSRRPAEI
jgi:hypothetical protein